jgi:uncharacterized YccA/Bax inhibitor family protein
MMRTSNPALNENVFRIEGTSTANVMTIEGTASKTMVLLGIVVLVAGIVWQMVYPAIAAAGAQVVENEGAMRGLTAIPANCWGFFMVGMIGGLIAAIVTIFKPKLAPMSAPVYAAFEGLFLGAFSAIFEFMYPGIIAAAVLATFGVLATMLVAYRFRIIRATEKFKMGVTAATGGIALVYLVSFVMSMFGGGGLGMIYSTGLIGIGFSVFVVIIAALNLVMDFDFIEKGAAYGAPKYMEWYGGFGLLVTLIWLYIEIVRLLAKLQSRN